MSADRRTGPTEGAGRSPGRDNHSVPPPCDNPAEPVTLFDPQETRQSHWTDALHGVGADGRRVDGQRDALDGAARSWKRDAARTIEQLALRSYRTGEPFTAEAIYEYCGPVVGPSENVVGALFSAAVKAKLIRAVGYTTATRPEANGRVLRTWTGTGGAS